MSNTTDVLDGWEVGEFTAAGITRPTYRRGEGPGVIVIHEIPGITPLVTKFANEVVDRGFTVVMPSLVGTPGKEPSNAYAVQQMAKVCVAQRVHVVRRSTRRRRSSPGCGRSPATSIRRSVAPASARSGCASPAASRSG